MRAPSGTLHVIDFKTDQIVANIQPQDYWDDIRHWEINNNIDTLEFKVFDNTEHAATLMQQNLVLKEVRDGRIVPYVINNEVEKDSRDRSLTVHVSGAWVQIAKDGYIMPQRIEVKTVNQFMDMALAGTKWKRGKTEYAGFHTMTIDTIIDPLTFLKKIASLFDLEIQYRVEVVGSQIVSWYVDMVKKRGRDTGKEVTLGKDLVGVRRIEHSRDVCTALVGFVQGEGDTIITVESINDGLPYITDSDAYQRWNENGKHKFGFYTPETEEQNMTSKRLLTLMKTEFAKRVNTSVAYDVEAAAIGRAFGLSHELINEGDTIRIKDTGFTPKLYLEARAIAGDESFTDPSQDKYVFGDYREITDPNEEMRKLYNRVLASLGNKANKELLEQLEKLAKEAKGTAEQAQKESKAAKDIAEKTKDYMDQNLVDIIEGANPPTTNLKPNKTLWRDISTGKPGVLKIWTGTTWEPVVPDTGPLQQSIKDVKKDIETAKTELNQKVQSVESKAQEIAGQIVDVQKQVNGKVDQTWIDNQLKDKADKSGVYTKDEIKDGFIGKQIYETDKQGNVQKFKDINTSMDQTNEALRQKAEKAELTKTNDGLTKLQNKTNEIETTANGTKQKLTELETTVNNTNVGVRNYVLDSDKFISPPDTNQGFRFVNDLKDLQGKQITVSVYVEIKNAKTSVNPSNRVGFEPSIRYSDNSIQHLGAWLRITDGMNFKGIISTTLSIKDIEVLKTEQNAVYIQCGGDYVKVGRPKIEIGNKVTDWTPAPEDQVTTTDFTKKTVEIETTIKGINTTVSNVQKEQGKLTERMTKSEQTADGFKTSIESLTKKDTEISNKLNTVESTVEGTKKTISDVQQTTSELKKTTTEITEKAGQISEKLISVEQKYDNMKIGGQNFYKQKSFGAAGGTTAKYDDSNKWWDIAIPAGASGSWKGILYTSKNAVLLVGRTYTISYEIYADEVISTAIDINNFGVTTVTGTNDNDLVAKRIMRTPKTIAGQWVKVSATFIMPDNITQDFYDNSVIGVGNGWTPTKITSIKIRNMQLEEGNIPTSYRTPSEDQVTTDEFTKKTTEIEKSVAGVKTTVSTVQKDQGAMQTTLNQVKQTTDSNSQTITSLSQTQGKQGEIVQQNTSDITQLNNQIKSKVTDTQMQEYVGGLGSTNLLFNTAFEDRVINATTGAVTSRKPSISKWSVGPNGSNFTAVPETARNHDGMNSVKLESSGQTVDRNAAFYQSLPVSPNSGDYVLSAWFYTDAVATIDNTAFVMIEFYNGSTWVTNKVVQLVPLLTNGSWKFVSVTMPAPASGVTTIRFVVVIRKNGRLWVSQPQLQQGITPSSFMENPKDYANYDQLVGEIAKKVATSDFDSKVSKMETTINQQSNRIDFKAETENVYSKTDADGRFGSKAMVERHESSITLMSNQINSTVKKGDIISSINQTAEQITIDVSKLAINADTMVKWLTAKGIDTNVINVNGDKITIDKNGVTVKMLDFLFEDEWGTKTTVIPKRNLIADHDFSSVPKLNIGTPNYQGFGAGYGLPWKVQGNGVVIENNTFIFNYEQMVNAVRVDTYNYPETKVQNGIHPGNSYTLSAHYRTAQINGVRTTAKPRLQVCFVTPLDDVTYKIWHEIYKDFPEPSTFYGEIRRYNFTFTVPNNYNPQEHMIVVKVTAANAQVSAGRAVCVSGITLVSGNYACMYNWDRAASERADGLQPFNRIAIGSVNNNIGPAAHGQTFDIITEKDVFINQPILTQGINLGRNRMGQAGSARFFDGGQGYGFYFMGMAGQWYKLPNV
ncbi:phage minor structural protein [Bacillus cereus VD196]|uniref:Phage minor structural protein n=2 Tax=Bacillus cereus TaxID=1396 RepID=A0A9W5V961_BACCE|nr:phage tail spike protein [Bacillus cereus]EOO67432.1 phage minor structural protein [Bacillus cereus VD196]